MIFRAIKNFIAYNLFNTLIQKCDSKRLYSTLRQKNGATPRKSQEALGRTISTLGKTRITSSLKIKNNLKKTRKKLIQNV